MAEVSIDDLLGEIPEDVKPAPTKSSTSKAPKEPKEPKAPRINKGVMVRFTNKAGQTITGMGVEYYVARMDGKLHYKEASQVTVLPDDWKEGDPIPGKEDSIAD